MSQTQCLPQPSIPAESTRSWRRVARDIAVACLASQPAALKLWEMRHFSRLILGALFRLEKATITTVTAGPSGQRFRMRLRWQAHTSYVLGLYEMDLIGVLQQHLRPGDTCMDLGAHVGYLTMLMARGVGPQGRVISFEPVPETCNALRENVRLNGFENVTTEAAAAGNQQGTLELVCTKGEELSWTASTLAYSQPGEEAHITVPVVKLDDYVQRNCLAAEAHQDRRRGSGAGSAAGRASDAEKDSSGSTGRNPRSGAFAQGTSPSSAPGARLCRH